MDLIVIGCGRLSQSYFENVFQLPAVGLLTEAAAYDLVRRGERELVQSGLFDVSETGLDLKVRKSSAGRYEVVLNVEGKVKRILTAKAEGNVQGRLGGTGLNGVVELAFRSPFGRGEKISFEQGFTQHGEPAATWSVYHPFLIPRSDIVGDRSFKMSFSRSFEDRTHMQSMSAKQTAFYIDLIPKVENGMTISAGALLGDANPTTSVKLKESSASAGLMDVFAAHSKVYISMGKLLQTRRGHVGCSMEIALPCGASRFLKSELFGVSRWTLGNIMCLEPSTPLGQYCHRVSASVSGAGGVIVPLTFQRTATLRPPSLMDRFYLGGPNSIRGFESLGLGPRSLAPHSGDCGDAIGGIGKLLAVFTLQLPCPTLPKPPQCDEIFRTLESTRLCFALSGGWLQSPYSWQSRQSQLFSAMSSEVRVSASMGVTLPLPQMGGELTLTYSIPLKASSCDVLKHWQLGFSVDFLPLMQPNDLRCLVRSLEQAVLLCRPRDVLAFSVRYLSDEKGSTTPIVSHAIHALPFLLLQPDAFRSAACTVYCSDRALRGAQCARKVIREIARSSMMAVATTLVETDAAAAAAAAAAASVDVSAISWQVDVVDSTVKDFLRSLDNFEFESFVVTLRLYLSSWVTLVWVQEILTKRTALLELQNSSLTRPPPGVRCEPSPHPLRQENLSVEDSQDYFKLLRDALAVDADVKTICLNVLKGHLARR